MIDEHKLLRDADKAARAQALLDNDLLKEVFEELEQEYIKALFLTHIDAVNAREKLFLAVNVVRKVRDHLNHVVADGKLASSQLQTLAELNERKRFGII